MTAIDSTGCSRFATSMRRTLPRAAILLCVLGLNLSCKSNNEPQTGSETNFLEHCTESCGPGLTCLCGVCTKACTGPNECSEWATQAQCVSVLEQPDSGVAGSCQQGATCDFTCVHNADCSELGSDYRCEAGFCRKGSLTCPANSLVAGDQDRQVTINDTVRTYTLHVPANYSGSAPVPLVLDFHPMGLGAQWEEGNSGYKTLSDQEGFIVVWPHGLENSWNLGPCCTSSTTSDDFGFARAIVRELSIDACIDPRRIYAVGDSMGGAMAYYLACNQAEVFASIAVSSMDLFADSELTCEPSRPVSEISFRGTADTVVPYAGGTSSPPGEPQFVNDLLGAEATFQKWASIDQCSGSPSTTDADGCSTYSTCQEGTVVTLCTTQNGGQVVGDANVAWAMLKAHPMP